MTVNTPATTQLALLRVIVSPAILWLVQMAFVSVSSLQHIHNVMCNCKINSI